MTDRSYDIALFGATGFTGRLAADYLARHAGRPLRFALAGRDRPRLEALRAELEARSPGGAPAGVIVARADEPASLDAMARATRVLITTVGPYAHRGEDLVGACVATGTDYVDITGEPVFVDAVVARYDAEARARGVRVVNCCGFDSVPHDLGVRFTVEQLPPGVPLQVEGFVRSRGTFSGGTWHSAIGAFAHLRESLAASRALARGSSAEGRRVRDLRPRLRYDRELQAWACPLPTIDPQIVLRSARALERYGPDFGYAHYAQVRSPLVLAGTVLGLGVVAGLAQLPPTRRLLLGARRSGEGPAPEQRARSWFRVTFRGEGGGLRVVTEVRGGDPGYDETAKMVCEAALCLAFDRERLPPAAGVLTPAVAMGAALTARLRAAGIDFEVISRAPRGATVAP